MLEGGWITARASLAWLAVAFVGVAAACSASDSKSGGQLPNGSGASMGSGGTSSTGGGAGAGGSGGGLGSGGSASGAGGGVGASGASGTTGGTMGGGGVSGATGSGGRSGSGGAGNVTFTWPETAPGTGKCKAGHYVGDFNGTFVPSAVFFPLPIPVSGTVDLTLQEGTNGEFFDISNGKVSGLANGLYPYSADVLGRLNCVTRKLENGFLKNGKYNALGADFPFEGPVSADYDTLTYAFVNGVWNVKEPNPTYGGNGTWNARFTP